MTYLIKEIAQQLYKEITDGYSPGDCDPFEDLNLVVTYLRSAYPEDVVEAIIIELIEIHQA